MTAVEVFAPAKINLALHVTGQRSDGYHELDSLVAFADVGDRLTLVDADRIAERPATTRLEITGPEVGSLSDDGSNLVQRAVDATVKDVAPLARLEKHLPVSSGIGGGSADAAAALRAVAGAWNLQIDHAETVERLKKIAAELGADVPMCLTSAPQRVRGIGDRLERVAMPAVHAVLVNPRIPLSTPRVFAALTRKSNAPLPWPPRRGSVLELAAWLRETRNDLEEPAIGLVPQIGDVLKALSWQPGVLLARMSGSGATCFGLFDNTGLAEIAAKTIRTAEPGWWVWDTVLGDMSEAARARVV